jgi:hypothetical protein
MAIEKKTDELEVQKVQETQEQDLLKVGDTFMFRGIEYVVTYYNSGKKRWTVQVYKS